MDTPDTDLFDSPYVVTWQDIINAEPIAELAGLFNPEWVYIYTHAADPQLEDCVGAPPQSVCGVCGGIGPRTVQGLLNGRVHLLDCLANGCLGFAVDDSVAT